MPSQNYEVDGVKVKVKSVSSSIVVYVLPDGRETRVGRKWFDQHSKRSEGEAKDALNMEELKKKQEERLKKFGGNARGTEPEKKSPMEEKREQQKQAGKDAEVVGRKSSKNNVPRPYYVVYKLKGVEKKEDFVSSAERDRFIGRSLPDGAAVVRKGMSNSKGNDAAPTIESRAADSAAAWNTNNAHVANRPVMDDDLAGLISGANIGAKATGGGYGPYTKTGRNSWKSSSGRLMSDSALASHLRGFNDIKIK